jgi:hypothetical protein
MVIVIAREYNMEERRSNGVMGAGLEGSRFIGWQVYRFAAGGSRE